MRVLEHRRHGPRLPGVAHLSREGVALARTVGATTGPFDRAVASPAARAVETVVALGWAVDDELAELRQVRDDVEAILSQSPPETFGDYVAAVERAEPVARFARSQAELWGRALLELPDGGRLLMVSHGGVIELGVAAAVPDLARRFGRTLGVLEGVRLVHDRGRWVTAELLRTGAPASLDPRITRRRRAATASSEPDASIGRSSSRRR